MNDKGYSIGAAPNVRGGNVCVLGFLLKRGLRTAVCWYYYYSSIQIANHTEKRKGLMKAMASLWMVFVVFLISSSVQAVEPEAEIFAAATGGKLAQIKQLVLDGAPIDNANAQGRTPVMAAAFYGNRRVVQFLLAEGADVMAVDNQEMTVLMLAAQSGNPDLIQLLVANGADIKAKNKSGQTAIVVAEMLGHSAVVAALEQLSSMGAAAEDSKNSKKK